MKGVVYSDRKPSPIGHLAASVLARRGHTVTVFDRNKQRLSYFNGCEIQTDQNLDDLARFDAIVEATGDPDALDTILTRSDAGTVILLLGLPYSRREFTFETIVGYDKTIVGSVGSTAKDFDAALATLPLIDTTKFAEKVLPLHEFKQAWNLSRTGAYLKVILQNEPAMD